MKQTIARIIQMVLLSAFFYAAAMFVLNKVTYKNKRLSCHFMPYLQKAGGQERLMALDFQSNKTYDVLVYGSSHVYRGYDPRNFERHGLSLFDAGSSAQSTRGSLILAKHLIPPSSGKLVIFDIYDAVWGIPDLENSNLLIQNIPNNAVKIESFTARPDIRKFNQLISSWFTGSHIIERTAKDYIANGYCSKPDTVQMPWAPVDIISTIDESYVNDFKELISLTESQNVKYIFVSHPLPAIKDLANNHNRLRPIIEEIAQKNGIIYLDYTHHPDFQNIENFADENHLNQAGVDRFNEMLIADLKKHNLLPQ